MDRTGSWARDPAEPRADRLRGVAPPRALLHARRARGPHAADDGSRQRAVSAPGRPRLVALARPRALLRDGRDTDAAGPGGLRPSARTSERGAGVSLTSPDENAAAPEAAVDVVALDAALERLAAVDPQQSACRRAQILHRSVGRADCRSARHLAGDGEARLGHCEAVALQRAWNDATMDDWPRVKPVSKKRWHATAPIDRRMSRRLAGPTTDCAPRSTSFSRRRARAADFLETPAALLLDRPRCAIRSARSSAGIGCESRLGAGGMGEVYRARDMRLDRDVALKFLPDAFAADADRLARFKREAQLLASLNHPHIAAIYGLEESAGRTRWC